MDVCGVSVLLERFDLELQVLILFEKKLLIGSLQGAQIFIGEPSALEADDVDASSGGGVAVNDHKGRHIAHDASKSGNHGVLAHAAELVYRTEAGDDGVVAYGDVACDGGIVREDGVAPDLALVGNMGIAQEEVVVADSSGSLRLGAAMDGDVLAKGIVIANVEVGLLALELQVLRPSAERGKGVGITALTDGGISLDDDVGA